MMVMPHFTRDDLIAIISACVRPTPYEGPWVEVLPENALASWDVLFQETIERCGYCSPSSGYIYLPIDEWNILTRKLVSNTAALLANAKHLIRPDRGPSADELAHAHHLPLWLPVMLGPFGPFLAGLDGDHPRPGGLWITTSQLLAIDPAGAWARTHVGWYRLGQRLNWAQIQALRGHGLSDVAREITDTELEQALARIRLDVQREIDELQWSRQALQALAS